MRMRKKKNLPARLERCAEYLVSTPQEHCGRWCANDMQGKSLHIELGCGKGTFTVKTAAARGDLLLVAIERVPDAMVMAAEHARETGLQNVKFIDGDAALLDTYFAPGEADCIYINFCDPWPTARHAKRRLTHPNFLVRYATVLKPGGEVQLKTDNRALFEWSLLQFEAAGYALREVTRDLHAAGPVGIMTDYEEKFHAQGLPIHRCVAVRCGEEESK